MTINQKRFIEELKRKIEYLNPPLLIEEGIIISHQEDKKNKYIRIDLKHRNKKEFDIWVAVYDGEIIIFFSTTHEHFYLCEEDIERNEWILDSIMFIIDILKGRYEIVIVYKGKKVTIVLYPHAADVPIAIKVSMLADLALIACKKPL